MFGYTRQCASAAAAIYYGLQTRQLRWVGVADRCAGVADDVVLGFDDEVIGHQFKSSRHPNPFRIATLLTGGSGLLPGLVQASDEEGLWADRREIRLRHGLSFPLAGQIPGARAGAFALTGPASALTLMQPRR